MKNSKLLQITLITFILIAAFSISSMPIFAEKSKYTIEILAYGICTTERTGVKSNQGVTKQWNSENINFSKNTEDIEGKLNVGFGISYIIHGPKRPKNVSVQRIWIFPKAMTNPEKNITSERSLRNEDYAVEEEQFSAYKFDHDWEIIPGVWTVEIWIDGQKLAEKSFTVTVP